MHKFLFIVGLLCVVYGLGRLLTGCTTTLASSGCSVIQLDDGLKFMCQDGTSATLKHSEITPIKICRNPESSYMFCINHDLYGVSSIFPYGGALGLMAVGTYDFDRYKAGCRFQILPDCKIKELE